MQQGNAYLALRGPDYQNNTILDIHECLVGAIASEYFKSGSLVSAIQNSFLRQKQFPFRLLSNHHLDSAQRVPEPDPLPGISFDTRPDPIQF